MSTTVKRADWVKVGDSNTLRIVKRVTRDGSWADVNWGWHRKRMQTKVLLVQHTISLGGGWTVTDEMRRQELEQEVAG